MNILITNDDGIMSPGIIELADRLSERHNVLVVAPDVERSATGHAITIRTPLWAKEVKVGNRMIGYAINGTPAALRFSCSPGRSKMAPRIFPGSA